MTDDQIIAKARLWAGLARPGVETTDARISPWGENRAVTVEWKDGLATAWQLGEHDAWVDPPSLDFWDPIFEDASRRGAG